MIDLVDIKFDLMQTFSKTLRNLKKILDCEP